MDKQEFEYKKVDDKKAHARARIKRLENDLKHEIEKQRWENAFKEYSEKSKYISALYSDLIEAREEYERLKKA